MSALHTVVIGLIVLYAYPGTGRSRYEPEALEKLLKVSAAVVKEGRAPIVIFDLDDTLFQSRSRTSRILAEFSRELVVRVEFPQESRVLQHLSQSEIQYDLTDTLKLKGIADAELIEEAKTYWATRFFSNEYVTWDIQVRGAANYARALHRKGVTLVYLTGRDELRMGDGTRKSLRMNRFPLGEQAELRLKPNKDLPDLAFKEAAFNEIQALGTVVAVFENEPSNLNAMMHKFPEAMGFFVDTIHSPKPILALETAHWIVGY